MREFFAKAKGIAKDAASEAHFSVHFDQSDWFPWSTTWQRWTAKNLPTLLWLYYFLGLVWQRIQFERTTADFNLFLYPEHTNKVLRFLMKYSIPFEVA